MLGSIGSTVRGQEDTENLWIRHIGGGIAGGISSATVLGVIGLAVSGTPYLWTCAVIGAVATLASLRAVGCLPWLDQLQVCRQVPSSWRLTMNPGRRAWLYGFQLGLGVVTYLWAKSVYVLIAIAMFDITTGLVAFAVFGLTRTASVAVIDVTARRTRFQQLPDVLPGAGQGVRLLESYALAAIAGYLLMEAAGMAGLQRVTAGVWR